MRYVEVPSTSPIFADCGVAGHSLYIDPNGTQQTLSATNRTMHAWSKHIEGATALVRMRGSTQFHDPLGLSLFRAIRTEIVSHCGIKFGFSILPLTKTVYELLTNWESTRRFSRDWRMA